MFQLLFSTRSRLPAHRRGRVGRGLAAAIGVVGLMASSVATPVSAATGPGAPAADEINGLVWLDRDADGVNDADEIGFAGAVVSLVDPGTGDVVESATTGADGWYSFAGLTGGPYTVQVDTDSAVYPPPSNFLPTLSGADQDVVQTGPDASIGEATNVALGSQVDAAWRPRPELAVGVIAVLDGTADFDAADPASGCGGSATGHGNPGYDCGDGNDQVRTQDLVKTQWSVTADNIDGLVSPVPVIFEQTIYPGVNPGGLPSVSTFASIPALCRPENNGGSSTPPSEIVTHADGSVTLVCNLGQFSGQKLFTSTIDVTSASPHASTLTTSAAVHMPDSANAAVDRAVPAASAPIGPIEVSAATAYDVRKSVAGSGVLQSDLDRNGDGDTDDPGEQDVPVMSILYFLDIVQERPKGGEMLAQPITITDLVTATDNADANPLTNFEYYINYCSPTTFPYGDHPYGRIGITSDADATNSVIDSGTCSYIRANPADTDSAYELTIDGADLSGSSFPTESVGGINYSAGPYYVASVEMRVFVPLDVVDAEDGDPSNGVGAINLYNEFSGFDPDSISGNSNYGAGVEPGYCDGAGNCEVMWDGSRSNNVVGPSGFVLRTSGFFAKYLRNQTNDGGIWSSFLPSQTFGHSGDGELEPGMPLHGRLTFHNNGTNPLRQVTLCDVFDKTVMHLTEATDVGGLPGDYAFVGTYDQLTPYNFDWPDKFKMQYAIADTSGDDPLVGGYSTSTGRYEGDWSAQSAASAECGDASTTWYDDPNSVPGGIDEVNMVKMVPADPDFAVPAGAYIAFVVPLKVRDNFHGGPHDGDQIPLGTVLANYGNRAWQQSDGSLGWLTPNYLPSPENSSETGDRATLTRVRVRLEKESLVPAAGVDQTGATLAGNQVVWKINPVVLSGLVPATSAHDVVVVDELPAEATYNATCTAAQAGATPPDLIQPNTDRHGNAAPGKTLLTWNLGDVPANDAAALPPRIFCTETDPLAPNGTNVVNYAEIRSSNAISSLPVRSDEHTIQLEQIGAIKTSKTVDRQLDPLGDSQIHTLRFANFSDASGVATPVVIDVLPWNGDGLGSLSERDPASDFTGVVTLDSVPTVTWLDGSTPGAGDPHPEMGVFWYSADAPATIDYNPDDNASTWCSYDGANFAMEVDHGGACPGAFADITAFRFQSNYDLTRDGDDRRGMAITMTLQATGNSAGDFYANRFAFDSSTLPTDQFLRSNTVTVQVEGFALGDLIFIDRDNNGTYTAGVDVPAPEGIPVEVYVDDDGTPGPSAGDTLVTTVPTNAQGRWLAERLPAGDYYARLTPATFGPGGLFSGYEVQPIGYEPDPNTDANDGGDHHASTPGTEEVDGVVTPVVTLSATPSGNTTDPSTGDEPVGDNTGALNTSVTDDFTNFTLDMAFKAKGDTGSIGDRVWVDTNGDGVQDPGEPGLNGATVILTWLGWDGVPGGGDDVVFTQVTSGDGSYLFDNLPPGEFTVEVSQVDSDLSPTYDLDGGDDSVASVSLASGEERHDVDFGYQPSFTLGDRVWIDVDGDGIYDPTVDAVPPAPVEVVLYHADGTPTGMTATTDADGNYSFTGLPAGDYYVEIPSSNLTGDLAGAIAAPNGEADPNTDVDDDADHNALTIPGGGIRSGVVTLSATYSDTPGEQVTGDEPGGFTNNTLDLALMRNPSISIDKEVCPDGATCDPAAGIGDGGWSEDELFPFGSTVRWRVVVTNTGGFDLVDVEVTDPLVPTCGATIGELDVGESTTIECTTANILVAVAPNTASVTGQTADGAELSDSDTASARVPDPDPGIRVVKLINGHDANSAPGVMVEAGSLAQFVFEVEVTENVPLVDVTVIDDVIPAADINCTFGTDTGDNVIAGPVPVGATFRCVAQYSSMPAGPHTNMATASGVPITGGNAVEASDPANAFGAESAVDIEKYVNGLDADDAPGLSTTPGQALTWTYVVTNTGNTVLTDVTVTDDQGVAVVCPNQDDVVASLAPGESFTCTGTGLAPQSGGYTNVGKVTATPPDTVDAEGQPVSHDPLVDDDPANVFTAFPAIDVEKYVVAGGVDHDADSAPGPSLRLNSMANWKIVVTNTGNITLNQVVVDDPTMTSLGAAVICPGGNPIPSLEVGASVECTVSHQVRTTGLFKNTVMATGTPPAMLDADGGVFVPNPVSDSDPAHYTGVRHGGYGRPLPRTGSDLTGWAIGVAVLLLVGGAGLVLIGRRRRTAVS